MEISQLSTEMETVGGRGVKSEGGVDGKAEVRDDALGALVADLFLSNGVDGGEGVLDVVGWESGSVTETCSKLLLSSPGLMSEDGCSSDVGGSSGDNSPVLAVAAVRTRRCRWVSSKVSPRKMGLREKRYASRTGSRRPLRWVVVEKRAGKVGKKLKFDEGMSTEAKVGKGSDRGKSKMADGTEKESGGSGGVLGGETSAESSADCGSGVPEVSSEELAEQVKVYDNFCRTTFWIQKTYGFTFEQYLAATGDIVGHNNVWYFNGDDRTRVEITVSEPQMVDTIVKRGLTIQGAWFKAYRKVDRPVLVALSGVPPVIPDVVVCKALEGIGDCAPSDCRAVYAPCEDSALKHIRSHRRRVWVRPRGIRPKGGVVLPEVLDIPFAGQVFTVNVSSGVPKCFGCGKTGHVRSSCRESKDVNGGRGGRTGGDRTYGERGSRDGGGGGRGSRNDGSGTGSNSKRGKTDDSSRGVEQEVRKGSTAPPVGKQKQVEKEKASEGVVNEVEAVNEVSAVAVVDDPVIVGEVGGGAVEKMGEVVNEGVSDVEDDFLRFRVILKGNEEWRHEGEDDPQCTREELLAVCGMVEDVRAAVDRTGKIPAKILNDIEIETLDRVLNCKDEDGLFIKGGKYHYVYEIMGDAAVWQYRFMHMEDETSCNSRKRRRSLDSSERSAVDGEE